MQTIIEVIDIKELSKIIGYTPNSIKTILSKNPERLPPKIKTLSSLRWYKPKVIEWLENASTNKKGGGRPRKVNSAF